MSKVTIRFYKIIQNYQEIGTNDECMLSRIYFDLEIDSKRYADLYVDVKQVVGEPYETAPLEVGPVQGNYRGPFNHEAFQKEAETYYRETFKRSIGIGQETNVVMENNAFHQEKIIKFNIE